MVDSTDRSNPVDRVLETRGLSIAYAGDTVLKDVDLYLEKNEIHGIIGPAGSGKSSFLTAINRMDEFTDDMTVDGSIRFMGYDVSQWRNTYSLRKRIGVVFPLPVGLPLSIYDNVALAPRLDGTSNKKKLDRIVERCLRRAALWDEVKDRLDSLGSLLSGGQQQRLTIARALSQDPDMLMLDEFSIAVDPVTTMRIEDVLKELKDEMSILLVTNLVQQAERLADRVTFFLNGEMVETSSAKEIFEGRVTDQRTKDYIEGRFG